ncbi:MAG: protein TolQ [Gammaproteobacteria bacterium]|jgi:biopolymer transport protein TolQ|nr:protein TolQ [Gammaproteobacteria bacterium]MBT3721770.1 protein TolQ [Gammaproteobacteria bacterium]MBT4077423.1 protein TolQ [Gammaproteobacteria bacterium]MBT4450781.1 protein TolQ [Gammaproteobacteria bacterium]MBT6457338.1 protein TolQ [Gammaproteobacteria bacterium]
MNEMSFIHLVVNASIPVQFVLVVLLLASVFSWALIYVKWSYLKQSRLEAKIFEGRFWSGINLSDLFSQLSTRQEKRFGLEAIFENGFREFARARKAELDAVETINASHRSMKVSTAREIDLLENNLSYLATVGSVSPYIGLFGTVWGIMESFRSLAGVQQATLAMVAPGISEALIATAMGLLAAIPAVIAYNGFATEIDQLVVRYENFLEEFTGILQRQAQTPAN